MTTETDAGDLIVSLRDDDLYIDQADPRIRISAELMYVILSDHHHRDVHVVGDVMTVDGINRRVVYRLGEYDPLTRTYSAEWPD